MRKLFLMLAFLLPLFAPDMSADNLGDSQHTKSDYTSDITLYAPEVIEIQYPKISSEDQLYPLCLFNSFGLEWNAKAAVIHLVLLHVKYSQTLI